MKTIIIFNHAELMKSMDSKIFSILYLNFHWAYWEHTYAENHYVSEIQIKLDALFLIFIYLGAPGLICGTWDLSMWYRGFSSGSVFPVVACRLQSLRAQSLQHVGLVNLNMWDLSSLTRDRTHIPCI